MDQMVGIIWDAAKCLCGCASEQAAYISDLEENLQSLKTKWEELQSMKQDVQRKVEEAENTGEMERTEEVSTWLQRIDGIQEAIGNIQVQGAQEIQNKCLSKCCPKNCLTSYKLGKDVVKMLQNVHELASFVNKEVEIACKIPPRPLEMPPEEIVGLDRMFQMVWQSIQAANVGIIGLYGMGGAGKTTLLKRIKNELSQRRPDVYAVMWVVVSKEHNLDKVMDAIRIQVGIGDEIWLRCTSQEDRISKIYPALKQKKFVLLLDGMWKELNLEKLGVPHPKETNFQSKVLFTTRFENVCAKMQAHTKFQVGLLMENEALVLFCNKVGANTLNSHHHIPRLVREMAEECKGLPLALIVVGSAMFGVEKVEEWKHLISNLRSRPLEILDMEEEVFYILKFAYDRLSNETNKKCFLSCALFPEDYEIEVDDLIDQWIGEGFMGKDWTKSVYEMYSHGVSVIENLKHSCLLESVEDDLGLTRRVKMHGVIRDMALWIARDHDNNKNKILVQQEALAASHDDNVEKRKIVERISIINSAVDRWHVPEATFPNLIALTFVADGYQRITGLSNIQCMRRLKVLKLSYEFATLELPPEIGGLILLEYLCLIGPMSTSTFPMELKNLKNLKFLSLRISSRNLAIIPAEVISSLEQLRVLKFLSRIQGEEKAFLENLESLQNLEELWIQIKTGNGLKKLHYSTKLQSCVSYLLLEGIKMLNMQLLLESMSKMKHLRVLIFRTLSFNIVENSSIFYKCCLSKLHTLRICYCSSIIHLTWVKYAPSLQQLEILDCESMEEVINEGTEDDKEKENVDEIFLDLVELRLYDLPKLKSIHKKALPFPSLRSMEISDCPKLNKLPFNSNSAKDNLRRIEGSQSWWDNLEWENQSIKDKVQTKFQALQQLKSRYSILLRDTA